MKTLFVESFRKIDKKFIYVVLFDFLFYLGLAVALLLFAKLLAWSLGSLYTLPGKLMAMSRMSDFAQVGAGADDLGLLLNQFKGKLALAFVVLWLLCVIVFTFFKGLAWSFVIRQKFDKKYIRQFFKLNLWWLGSIAVLCLLFFWLTKPAATGFAVLLILSIALYLAPVLYAVFNPAEGIKELFARLWRVGVERFYYFILPWIIAQALLLAAVGIISSVLAAIYPNAALFALFAVMIVWQAWFKYYIYLVARGIK